MGACRPLYTKNGWYLCTENYDLPYTREACEELCGKLRENVVDVWTGMG